MATLYIKTIVPFDARYDYTIGFHYSGGNQAVKNKLQIRENGTLVSVYNFEKTTFELSRVVPAGTLQNGKQYECMVTVFDINNDSYSSNWVLFYCCSTPEWNFINLEKNQVIKNASYTVYIKYAQPDKEALNEYKVTLYSFDRNVVWDSGILYDASLSVNVTGLMHDANYYLQATGKTVSGILLDTGLVPVSVEYTSFSYKPDDDYALIELDNLEDQGMVKISSNLGFINGVLHGKNSVYINNEKLDLRPDGSYAIFDNKIAFSDNFTLEILGNDFIVNRKILTLSNENNQTDLYWRVLETELDLANSIIDTDVLYVPTNCITFKGTEQFENGQIQPFDTGLVLIKVISETPIEFTDLDVKYMLSTHFTNYISVNNDSDYLNVSDEGWGHDPTNANKINFWIKKTRLSSPDGYGFQAWVKERYKNSAPLQILSSLIEPDVQITSPANVVYLPIDINTSSYTNGQWRSVYFYVELINSSKNMPQTGLGSFGYVVFSNLINKTSTFNTDDVHIWVRYIDGLFKVIATNKNVLGGVNT